MRPRRLPVLLVAVALAGCGGEDPDDQVTRDPGGGGGADNAVEARETNVARMGGISYRVVLFRELNVNTEADAALVDRPPPDGRGYWAAFVEACNETSEDQVPTDRIVLETAFGRAFEPLERRPDDDFAYEPRRLQPEACIPSAGSAADRTFDGAAVVFELPYDAVQNRPLILELRPRERSGDAGPIRIELDL